MGTLWQDLEGGNTRISGSFRGSDLVLDYNADSLWHQVEDKGVNRIRSDPSLPSRKRRGVVYRLNKARAQNKKNFLFISSGL